MKNSAGLIVTVLIIVAPIVWCCVNLFNTNRQYEDDIDRMQSMQDDINNIANEQTGITNSGDTTSSGDTYTMGGDSYQSTIGAPIGKIVEKATINVASANVYSDPDEASTIVGAVTQNTEVTAQDYPQGWTRVKVGEISGWVKTEFIKKPDDTPDTSIGTVIGKNAVVNVDSLNVRAEASSSSAIIDHFTMDTEVKILAVSDDNKWYQVQWRTVLGWVSADYVTVQY